MSDGPGKCVCVCHFWGSAVRDSWRWADYGFSKGGKAGSWLSERQHFGNTHLLPPSQWATRSTQLISVSVRARDQLKCPMGFRTKKSGNQSWSADQVWVKNSTQGLCAGVLKMKPKQTADIKSCRVARQKAAGQYPYAVTTFCPLFRPPWLSDF